MTTPPLVRPNDASTLDYSLFILSRYREEMERLADELPIEQVAGVELRVLSHGYENS